MSITVPIGTRLYLTKRKDPSYALYIKPDRVVPNEELFVAYDVKIGTITAIPKGTRVIGNWITESTPVLAAQFQAHTIFLTNKGLEFHADSVPIQTITIVDPAEVGDATLIIKEADYISPARVLRRIVTVRCRTFALLDDISPADIPNGTYLNINTTEIPATVIANFIINFNCILPL
jgi:hypothetical protein